MSGAFTDQRPWAGKVRQRDLWRMIVPLSLVFIALDVYQTVFSGILARFETATDELAAYGVGFYLIMLCMSPTLHVDQMTLVYGKNRRSLLRILGVGAACGGVLMLLALLISQVPWLRQVVITDLQRVPDQAIAERVAFVLAMLSPLPLIDILSRVMRGALIRAHKAHLITIIVSVSRASAIGSALLLFQTPFVQERPLLLPVLAYYTDGALRIVLYSIVGARVVWPRLPAEGQAPRLRSLLDFSYPLIMTSVMMAASRPVINGFLGPLPNGKQALAALAIAMPLSQLFHGWLNDVRVLLSAFKGAPGSVRAVRRFALTGAGGVFIIVCAVFYSAMGDWVLRHVMGVPAELIGPCRAAMWVFCFMPLAVSARAFYQGLSIARRRTNAMTWSGPLRIAIIVAMLLGAQILGVGGAALGAAALLAGFLTEALVIWASLNGGVEAARLRLIRAVWGRGPAVIEPQKEKA